MDVVVDRNTENMRNYVSFVKQYIDEFEFYNANLECELSIARELMKDKTGKNAINKIILAIEDIKSQLLLMEDLSQEILKSARLIEQSEEIL